MINIFLLLKLKIFRVISKNYFSSFISSVRKLREKPYSSRYLF